MKNKIIGLVILVVVGAGCFYAGTAYQKSKTPVQTANNRGGQGGGNGGRFRGGAGGPVGQGGGFVNGQVIAKDDKSITVQLPNNGGTKIVFLSGNSQISKSVSGAVTDLSVGQMV